MPLFWSWLQQQSRIDPPHSMHAKTVSIFVYKTDSKAFTVSTNPISGVTASVLLTESWKPRSRTGSQPPAQQQLQTDLPAASLWSQRLLEWSKISELTFSNQLINIFFSWLPPEHYLKIKGVSGGEKRGQGWSSTPVVRKLIVWVPLKKECLHKIFYFSGGKAALCFFSCGKKNCDAKNQSISGRIRIATVT